MQARPRIGLLAMPHSLVDRLAAMLRHVRLTPFDVSTPAGRDAERYRRAALGVLSNVLARGAAVLLIVIGVKLTLPYLGAERFGVWATFASMAAMLAMLDLGVGNALINRVAQAGAADDPAALRDAVSGGCGVLLAFGLLSGVVLLVLAAVCPWERVFHLTDPVAAAEAATTARVFAGVFALHVVTSGLLKVLVGQQRSYEANLIAMAGSLLACAAITWCAHVQAGVPWLLASTFGVQAFSALSAALLLQRRGLLVPAAIPDATRRERAGLLRSGALFLLLQVGTMIGWGSDSLVLATLAGAGQVAVFAIAQRLFQFASMPVALINTPLWAAYADAVARGDRAFIARSLRTSMGVSAGLGLLLVVVLAAASQPVVAWWTGGEVGVPRQVIVLFAAWTLLEICGNAFAMYLNGCAIIRQQVWVVAAFCALAIPLKIVLTLHYGIPGLLAGTIVAYLAAVVLPYATVFRRTVLAPLSP